MNAGNRPRFDIDALRSLAGDTVFARGEAYHRDGQVEILGIESQRVLAQVAGSEDYRTELTGRGKAIGGDCSCPAFRDRGFCKHMVAVALAANATDGVAEADGASALPRMRDHLRGMGIDGLVAMIMDMAERDPALFRRLDLAAAAVRADDRTLEARLRKAVDSATRTRGYVEYEEADGWAANVDSTLDVIADLVPGSRAGLALALIERAIDRIEQAVESIDDSDGHCAALLDRAREIHLAAAHAARPEPVQLARDLFAREMQDDQGTFGGAVLHYADVLGDDGLREYRRLASEAWGKLPPRPGGARGEHGISGEYRVLLGILDVFAERDGDVDARIALRTKDLSSPWNYLQLAEFCLAQGREEDALRRAEEGLWVFEDSHLDQRLLFFVVDRLSKAGRKADAEAHLWRAFERQPSLELFARLRPLGGEAARDRALAFLEARLAKQERTPWSFPADLLVSILMHERMFDAAWATSREHGAAPKLKESLARASDTTHPREALETYAERVEQLAQGGGNEAYGEAVELIARMAALRGPAEQAAYVTAIKARHGRKRNFMKLLG